MLTAQRGHYSAGEMSYRLEDALFIGDTVPVITDIPIIIDVPEMIASIKDAEVPKRIPQLLPGIGSCVFS